MKSVWLLRYTEYSNEWAGIQQATYLVAVFDEKPSLEQIAPMLTEWLPKDDMGLAISRLTKLLDKGHCEGDQWASTRPDITLQEVPLNEMLHPE